MLWGDEVWLLLVDFDMPNPFVADFQSRSNTSSSSIQKATRTCSSPLDKPTFSRLLLPIRSSPLKAVVFRPFKMSLGQSTYRNVPRTDTLSN